MKENSFISKIIIDEIGGKNQAIHAYDKMIWTVRTGFLTVFFAGWGILLKSFVDKSSDQPISQHDILIVMLLISITLSCGGYIIDVNYVRRKFRVIYALDKLLLTIMKRRETIISDPQEIEKYLQVSGDKYDDNYKKVSGYSPALKSALIIYVVPIIVATAAIIMLW